MSTDKKKLPKVPRQFYGVFRNRGLRSVHAKRRTVAHFHDSVPSSKFSEIKPGDRFIVMGQCGQPARRGLICHVVAVSREPLLELLTGEELIKLDCFREGQLDEYFQSWDEFHPDALARTNPRALRVEFEVGDKWVDIPQTPEQTIIDCMSKIALAEIVAKEDARAFADISPASNEVSP